jgi:hypothetical protein
VTDLYFELNLFLQDLAKNYGAPNASYYFRINKIKPSKEEYRRKVVEFMRHYEYTLNSFAGTPDYDKFRSFANDMMKKMIDEVLSGDNKEVEKRYKYYMMNE